MLKIDSINYLGSCRRGERGDEEPVTGLVVASFELGTLNIEQYSVFFAELMRFVDIYNARQQDRRLMPQTWIIEPDGQLGGDAVNCGLCDYRLLDQDVQWMAEHKRYRLPLLCPCCDATGHPKPSEKF